MTLNSRDFSLGPHGTAVSRREYDRLVKKWLGSSRSISFGSPEQDITVVELISDYLTFAKTYYGTGRTSEYHQLIRIMGLLRGFYGRTPAAGFGVLEFKAVRQQLMSQDLSRGYVKE